MEATKETNLKIELKGDDAKNFESALKKCVEEKKTIGFRKSTLSEDERKVLKELSEKL